MEKASGTELFKPFYGRIYYLTGRFSDFFKKSLLRVKHIYFP